MTTQARRPHIQYPLSTEWIPHILCLLCICRRYRCYPFGDYDGYTRGRGHQRHAEVVLDCWGGVLRATGGALVPEKSYWYVIDFKWDGQQWAYPSKTDMLGDILITGADGKHQVVLMGHEPDVGQETLEVIQAMDGNTSAAEISHLHKKAEESLLN
jgi:hypothetical protein